MDNKTKDELRAIIANPSTGQVYNKQQLFAQVQGVFAMDRLEEEIAELRGELKESNAQSVKLAFSNYRLQLAVFSLTSVAVFISVYEFINRNFIDDLASVFQNFSIINPEYVSVTISLLSAIFVLVAQKKLSDTQLHETVKLNDQLDILSKDFQGNEKDRR